jgi:hypothetical protein
MDKNFIKYVLKKSKKGFLRKLLFKRKLLKVEKILNEMDLTLLDFSNYKKLHNKFVRYQKIKKINKT